MKAENIEVNRVVYLNVSDAEVIRRLTSRGRADDTPDIIKNRLKVYDRETGPVVDYYKGKKEFYSIKAEGDTPENTAKKIIKDIKE